MNPETGVSRDVELVMDTDSIFTWVNKDTLESIGIKPRSITQFKTINGRVVVRGIDLVAIWYETYEDNVEVVIGETRRC
ncbi:hypothetical protein [Caldivirga sp.]|jgi:predicted aspartyl protease|uniref:hypothetical protein n=1 Tax=Caldivirga sp. TaxID=2080243 RepID=UPI003D09627E